jgi:phosphate transport system substrate-binding protein
MKTLKGICLNRENCPLSTREEVITVDKGDAFVCPICAAKLKEVKLKDAAPRRINANSLVAAALILIAFSAVGFVLWGDRLYGSAATEEHSKVLLRLAGSNTIGESLGPALAEAYLRVHGATDIAVKPGNEPDAKTVVGILPGNSDPVEIEIAAHGSATAFASLANGSCDIGMASRRVNNDEVAKLAALGTMTDPDHEHILGLDGIAIIVNSRNSLKDISKTELQRIFTGKETKWRNGDVIDLYARDDKSGTYDTFKTLVLNGKPLAPDAKRFENSEALSDAVASDPNAIGFIGLPFIRDTKALAISDTGTTPLLPTPLTVATEDYSLSRRLYLYTPSQSANPRVRDFVEFALSPAGQEVLAENSFVAQTAQQVAQKAAPNAPPEYLTLTAKAERIPINFRFLNGGSKLDNASLADLDRVVAQLAKEGSDKVRVLLFGFSDESGTIESNQALSQSRAQIVADELSRRGITPFIVAGFGSALPVASNQSSDGREKNRRVEIWVSNGNTAATGGQ